MHSVLILFHFMNRLFFLLAELPSFHQNHSNRQWTAILLHCSHITGCCWGENKLSGKKCQRPAWAVSWLALPDRGLQSVSFLNFITSMDGLSVLYYSLCLCVLYKFVIRPIAFCSSTHLSQPWWRTHQKGIFNHWFKPKGLDMRKIWVCDQYQGEICGGGGVFKYITPGQWDPDSKYCV